MIGPIQQRFLRTLMGHRPRGDRAFDALADPYRRQLLLALAEANPQQDDDLDPLGLLQAGESTDDVGVTRVELRHVHLPKLADAGYVEWDRESGDLSTGPEWEEIAPLVRLLADHRDELPDGWLSGSASDT